ncbi:MAG: hypothetical protein PHR36_04920 [Patescibacteria group bacterium]|nr:hypothetical protein [Patescibacteria group bacterium]
MKNFFKKGGKSDGQAEKRNSGNGSEFNRRDFSRPGMFKAVCDKCGKECEVPFRPTAGKPVYCNNCFEKPNRDNSGGGRERNRQRSGFGDKQRYEAVCAKCGKECEVPFRPTAGKPVYCEQCFKKEKHGGEKGPDQSKQQFEILNAKLDKILSVLNPNASPKPVKEVRAEKIKMPKKSQTKAKPVPKKIKKKK